MDYEYNDYELVYLVRESSEEATEVIMQKYEPIVKNIAFSIMNKFGMKNIDFEDVFQEGRLGLVVAINTFDQDKDVLFYTFATICIKGKILNYLRKNLAKKSRLPIYLSNEEDDILDIIPDFRYEPGKCLGDAFINDIIVNFKNELSFDDSLVFELKINDFSYDEISILLDKSKKYVDNKLLVIRKKFKKYLLNI